MLWSIRRLGFTWECNYTSTCPFCMDRYGWWLWTHRSAHNDSPAVCDSLVFFLGKHTVEWQWCNLLVRHLLYSRSGAGFVLTSFRTPTAKELVQGQREHHWIVLPGSLQLLGAACAFQAGVCKSQDRNMSIPRTLILHKDFCGEMVAPINIGHGSLITFSSHLLKASAHTDIWNTSCLWNRKYRWLEPHFPDEEPGAGRTWYPRSSSEVVPEPGLAPRGPASGPLGSFSAVQFRSTPVI